MCSFQRALVLWTAAQWSERWRMPPWLLLGQGKKVCQISRAVSSVNRWHEPKSSRPPPPPRRIIRVNSYTTQVGALGRLLHPSTLWIVPHGCSWRWCFFFALRSSKKKNTHNRMSSFLNTETHTHTFITLYFFLKHRSLMRWYIHSKKWHWIWQYHGRIDRFITLWLKPELFQSMSIWNITTT